MISLAPLGNAVPRWFGKNFFPNQRGVFGNTNHCKTRADQLSQRKASKVGKNPNSLKSHLFPMARVFQPRSKTDAYFCCTKVHFFLSYNWNTLQGNYNQVCRVNTTLKTKTLSTRSRKRWYFCTASGGASKNLELKGKFLEYLRKLSERKGVKKTSGS